MNCLATLVVDGIDLKYQIKPQDLFFWFRERLESCRFDGDRWWFTAVR